MIVTFVVIKQIKCFEYQIKAEMIDIKMVKQTWKNIKMMQFWMQIELTYKNLKQNILCGISVIFINSYIMTILAENSTFLGVIILLKIIVTNHMPNTKWHSN